MIVTNVSREKLTPNDHIQRTPGSALRLLAVPFAANAPSIAADVERMATAK